MTKKHFERETREHSGMWWMRDRESLPWPMVSNEVGTQRKYRVASGLEMGLTSEKGSCRGEESWCRQGLSWLAKTKLLRGGYDSKQSDGGNRSMEGLRPLPFYCHWQAEEALWVEIPFIRQGAIPQVFSITSVQRKLDVSVQEATIQAPLPSSRRKHCTVFSELWDIGS